eukprot:5167119-Ditylum_brightwellii.AAC.1
MEHAHQSGIHQDITRAVVICDYPWPLHVFLDTSPDTDADFEVTATFDTEPAHDDVNMAIVKCLSICNGKVNTKGKEKGEKLMQTQKNRMD